jgi:hypothetical protein
MTEPGVTLTGWQLRASFWHTSTGRRLNACSDRWQADLFEGLDTFLI